MIPISDDPPMQVNLTKSDGRIGPDSLPKSREQFVASADLGRQVAALLDPETPVPGVTAGKVRP
jgi:hypothetical protein